ncbi:MAG: hypothetical protein U0166_05885 [Acidobacteriota bacterium]
MSGAWNGLVAIDGIARALVWEATQAAASAADHPGRRAQICGAVGIGVFLFLLFLVLAVQAREPSRALANLALACGALVMARPESVVEFGRPAILLSGGVRVVLGASGFVLGGLALVRRRRDRGTGIARPVAGMLLSILNGLSGTLPLLLLLHPGKPAPLPLPQYGIVVVLPPGRWVPLQEQPADAFGMAQGSRAFAVGAVPGDEATFRSNVAALEHEKRLLADVVEGPDEVEGATSRGDRFATVTVVVKVPDGEQLDVDSMVLCAGRVVRLKFAGHMTLRSDVGKRVLRDEHERVARELLLSIAPIP